MIVAKAVAAVPIFTDRLAGRTDARSGEAADAGQPRTRLAATAATTPVTWRGIRLVFTISLPNPLPQGVQATLSFQTTNPTTNQVTGTASIAVNIAPGGSQSFVFAITPLVAFAATDIALVFDCTNTDPAPSVSGLNTLLLSGAATSVADIVALAATLTGDGIANVQGNAGTGVFAVATSNVGSADTMNVELRSFSQSVLSSLFASVCLTNPTTGACLGSAVGSGQLTASIPAGATPTFGIFLTGNGNLAFDPSSTSVAVRTVGGTPAAPGFGCPSVYDGTYIGQLAYNNLVKDQNSVLQRQARSINMTITLQCQVALAGTATLKITSVSASHPAFGCQGSCVPALGIATLPMNPPTTVSNQSQIGHGLTIQFPNGSSFSTSNGIVGALTVTSALTISNGLDPSIANNTWAALPGVPPTNPNQIIWIDPTDGQPETTRWTFSKSAL